MYIYIYIYTRKNIQVSVVLILLGQHCTGKNLCSVVPMRLQMTLHMKKSQSMFSEQNRFTAIFILNSLSF